MNENDAQNINEDSEDVKENDIDIKVGLEDGHQRANWREPGNNHGEQDGERIRDLGATRDRVQGAFGAGNHPIRTSVEGVPKVKDESLGMSIDEVKHALEKKNAPDEKNAPEKNA
jgi:hypothetical protein